MVLQLDYIKIPSIVSNKYVFSFFRFGYTILSKFESIRNTGVIKHINKEIERFYVEVTGINTILTSGELQNASTILIKSKSILDKTVSLYALLEDSKFFNNVDTKEIVEKALNAAYDLEFTAKKLAFKNKKHSGKTSIEAEIALKTQNQAFSY